MKPILASLAALFAITAHAQGTAPPGQPPDPKILEGIFACLAEGLPPGWKKAWFVIDEIGRSDDGKRHFEANFFYATRSDDAKGNPLTPCGAERVLQGVSALNAYLPEHERRWTGATFTFTSEGRYDVTYDYSVRGSVLFKPGAEGAAESAAKPAAEPPAKPALKPAAKKAGQGLKLP
jgi:hypothetical protein